LEDFVDELRDTHDDIRQAESKKEKAMAKRMEALQVLLEEKNKQLESRQQCTTGLSFSTVVQGVNGLGVDLEKRRLESQKKKYQLYVNHETFEPRKALEVVTKSLVPTMTQEDVSIEKTRRGLVVTCSSKEKMEKA